MNGGWSTVVAHGPSRVRTLDVITVLALGLFLPDLVEQGSWRAYVAAPLLVFGVVQVTRGLVHQVLEYRDRSSRQPSSPTGKSDDSP